MRRSRAAKVRLRIADAVGASPDVSRTTLRRLAIHAANYEHNVAVLRTRFKTALSIAAVGIALLPFATTIPAVSSALHLRPVTIWSALAAAILSDLALYSSVWWFKLPRRIRRFVGLDAFAFGWFSLATSLYVYYICTAAVLPIAVRLALSVVLLKWIYVILQLAARLWLEERIRRQNELTGVVVDLLEAYDALRNQDRRVDRLQWRGDCRRRLKAIALRVKEVWPILLDAKNTVAETLAHATSGRIDGIASDLVAATEYDEDTAAADVQALVVVVIAGRWSTLTVDKPNDVVSGEPQWSASGIVRELAIALLPAAALVVIRFTGLFLPPAIEPYMTFVVYGWLVVNMLRILDPSLRERLESADRFISLVRADIRR